MQPAEYAKAIVGAAIAGVTALGTALADETIKAQEWVGIVLATLVTFAGVWRVPNRPPQPQERQGSRIYRGEHGLTDVLYILACLFVGLLIVAAFLKLFPE